MKNTAVIFYSRPDGMPSEEHFRIAQVDLPQVQNGQVLIRTLYLSADPYMRERMTPMKSYIAPFEVGGVIDGTLIGTVVESKHADFEVGEVVYGFMKWQAYNVSDGTGLSKVAKDIRQPQLALGTLGSPGLTAYFGLIEVGQLRHGETVVVSGAGGAVGTVVVQLAKQYGCRVVAITGSDDKNRYLLEALGVDAAINYKTAGDMQAALGAVCPDGIDVYFDNVGNEILNAVASLITKGGRILLCGQISQYNGETPHLDPRMLGKLTKQSAVMKGFLISHFTKDQVVAARSHLTKLVNAGNLKTAETVVNDLENAPKAIIGLFNGSNTGKMLVNVAGEHVV